MAFKVKDLMINVVPAADRPCTGGTLPCVAGSHPCALGQVVCTHVSVCRCTLLGTACACSLMSMCTQGCTFFSCPGCSVNSVCTPCGTAPSLINPTCSIGPDPETTLNALAALKAQLQQQLAVIGEQEQGLQPQTVAEVDELQSRLQAAMDELKTRRAELAKKEKK